MPVGIPVGTPIKQPLHPTHQPIHRVPHRTRNPIAPVRVAVNSVRPVPVHLHTVLIRMATPLLARRHLARRHSVTRRHIEGGIAQEEIARPQQQGHRLDGHDGVVLGGGEVGDAKGVPEHDVGVGDVFGGVGVDPLGEAHGGFAGGLGHVAAGGVDLVVGVCVGWCQFVGDGRKRQTKKTYIW